MGASDSSFYDQRIPTSFRQEVIYRFSIPHELLKNSHLPSTDSYTARKYAAFAQVYRWTQVYETDLTPKRVQNVLDALTDDFVLNNVDGKWRGKEKYIERLGLLKRWEMANHIQKLKYNKVAGGCVVEVLSLYQIRLPDESLHNYEVKFLIGMRRVGDELPLIHEITVQPTLLDDRTPFKRSYHINRGLAFFYKWLYIMELYGNNSYYTGSLFTGDHTVEFGDPKVPKTARHIADWMLLHYASLGAPVFNSKQFRIEPDSNDCLVVQADLANRARSLTLHYTWDLAKEPDEAFPRIRRMRMTAEGA
jgi:hypothetical protein